MEPKRTARTLRAETTGDRIDMTQFGIDEFVQAFYRFAFVSGVESALSNVAHPPGREPREELVELHAWFQGLDRGDQEMLANAMALSADYAVFGVFAIMDGVRPITDGFSREVHASLVGEGEVLPLSPDGDLHDYFRSIVDENRTRFVDELRSHLDNLTDGRSS